MNKASYYISRLMVGIFSVLPFWFIYLISDLLAFLLHSVFRYRRKVVKENLKNAFPDKSSSWYNNTSRSFYINLSDIVLETIKGFSLTRKGLMNKFNLLNPELIHQYTEKGRSVVVLGAHFNNWEWGSTGGPLYLNPVLVGVYKPLSNKALDGFLARMRGKWGGLMCPMNEIVRKLVERKDIPSIYAFIADQTPVDIENAHWIRFLNQNTPFLHGAEKLARKKNLPVLLYFSKRVKRGHYEVTLEEITNDILALEYGLVTRIYAEKLEERIKQKPAEWLWSHRRWKRSHLYEDLKKRGKINA